MSREPKACPICSQIMGRRDSYTIHLTVAHPGVLEFAGYPAPTVETEGPVDCYCDGLDEDCPSDECDGNCALDDAEGGTFEDTFAEIAAECLDLLVKKQVSYGPKNIESLAVEGRLIYIAFLRGHLAAAHEAIAEGDGISVLVEVVDGAGARAAQDQGAEGQGQGAVDAVGAVTVQQRAAARRRASPREARWAA